MAEKIAGIILAGGRSSRMGGGDKCLSALAGRPLLSHVIERLAPQVDDFALNANGDRARFAVFGLEVVPDSMADAGPLAGVLAGMRWARRRAPTCARILTVAADTPFLPHDLAARLAAADDGTGRIVVAQSGGRSHPTFALWPVSLADDLEHYLAGEGSSSMRAYAGEHRPAVHVDFACGGRDPFFNVNTPQDLQEAERLAEEAG